MMEDWRNAPRASQHSSIPSFQYSRELEGEDR
jgi:hypothetical protein